MSPSNGVKGWNVTATRVSKRTVNPIRQIVDNLKVVPNPDKPMISMGIGDPTVFGNFEVPDSVNDAMIEVLKTKKYNGYFPASGSDAAREAVARKFNTTQAPLEKKDVLIASGASGALDIAIGALCEEGSTILIPRPGYSLYETLASTKGIDFKYYDLIPDRNWEADLSQLESLIDSKTSCILVNNPSNPCGSVYTKKHLLDVINLCKKHHIPIIADEIYADMVFSGFSFHSMASLTQDVPMLVIGGLAKQYLIPGWRVGWILVYDYVHAFDSEVRDGLERLTQLIVGANSVVQGALPKILHETPKSFYSDTLKQLEGNAQLTKERLSAIPGLQVIVPQGAMYVMVGIDLKQFKGFSSDLDFTEKLISEESVLCLPGQCFKYPNFFRIVITPPKGKLEEAYTRMAEFCSRHHV